MRLGFTDFLLYNNLKSARSWTLRASILTFFLGGEAGALNVQLRTPQKNSF
jgi:hypothetical protein